MPKMIFWAVLALALPFAASAAAPEAIPWPNRLEYPVAKSAVNMSYLNQADIDRNGIVFVKNGHFWTKQGRINFFGTNLTFNACFPEQKTAEQLAAQLAGLGVNLVRLHHMDNRDIWGKNRTDYQEFDSAQLDKMDYLIYCLKRRGIYVDLNLHVSWQYTNDPNNPAYGLIRDEDAFKYGKGLDTFLPDLIMKQKKYAQALFNHHNQYTGLAYKDDPVIALVEINNENSFYRNMIIQGGLDLLPAAYRQILNERFRQYLHRKYPDFDGLRQAWTSDDTAARPVEIANILPFNSRNNWQVQISDPQKGTITLLNDKAAVHLNYAAKNKFFQFYKTNLSFQKNDDYTLVVDISGAKGTVFNINAMRQGPPYESIGLTKRLRISDNTRQVFIIPFQATADLDHIGRITLGDFNNGTEFTINSLRLFHGKCRLDPLHNITRIADLRLPALTDFPAYRAGYQADLGAFFRQTELSYWSDMVRYLKTGLGVKAPITGTQIDYSLPELAKVYDYLDIHAYWQHPSFPGNPWDPKDYYVRNVSMVSEPKTNFDKIALFRIKGKPYTISEYNHPYPNFHTAETPTMLAVVSKLQDYDGVMMFNFLNNLDLDPPSYFSHYNKFACKAVYPVAALIMRDPAIPPLPEETVWNLGKKEMNDDLLRIKPFVNPYLNELNGQPERVFDVFKAKRIALQFADRAPGEIGKEKDSAAPADTHFVWENAKNDYHQTFFKYDGAKAKVYIGWNIAPQYDLENVSFQINGAANRYFQLTILNQNGPVGQKGHYIITLTGREFYTNVNYYDYDSKALVDPAQENYRTKIMAVPAAKQNEELIENFNARLRLKLYKPYQSCAVYTINSRGEKEKDIGVKVVNQELQLDLKQQDNSVVYCLEIGD